LTSRGVPFGRCAAASSAASTPRSRPLGSGRATPRARPGHPLGAGTPSGRSVMARYPRSVWRDEAFANQRILPVTRIFSGRKRCDGAKLQGRERRLVGNVDCRRDVQGRSSETTWLVLLKTDDRGMGWLPHPRFPQQCTWPGKEQRTISMEQRTAGDDACGSSIRARAYRPTLRPEFPMATGPAKSGVPAKTMRRGGSESWLFFADRSLFPGIDGGSALWACVKRGALRGEVDS
jgi:hypothetical protein